VRRLLKEDGYSLQANRKTLEGKSVPERDSQFRYINNQAAEFIDADDPVISVDAKKKELIGDYKNSGRTWKPKGQPEQVNVYDFPSKAIGAAIPYGVYYLKMNKGVVNVGKSHNTAEFAVESIRQWWNLVGKYNYVDSKNLLICADGGGSNGSRNRGWKFFLQELEDEIGITITVCHFPPGTSKWNQTACGHPTLKDGVCFGPHALTPGFMESRNRRVFVALISLIHTIGTPLSVSPGIP
jgi:hypothetical protein